MSKVVYRHAIACRKFDTGTCSVQVAAQDQGVLK